MKRLSIIFGRKSFLVLFKEFIGCSFTPVKKNRTKSVKENFLIVRIKYTCQVPHLLRPLWLPGVAGPYKRPDEGASTCNYYPDKVQGLPTSPIIQRQGG